MCYHLKTNYKAVGQYATWSHQRSRFLRGALIPDVCCQTRSSGWGDNVLLSCGSSIRSPPWRIGNLVMQC